MPRPDPPDFLDFILLDEQQQLLENPEPALTSIGALLTSVSQQAFQLERLGDIRWEPRYPNQTGPKLNVAGALSDLNQGSFVRERRLQDRPVLQDKGLLKQSINWNVIGTDLVRIGSTGPAASYAANHQFGLISTQNVTSLARETLTKQRKKARGTMREALGTLGFLYSVDELETQIVKRPFLGIPDETAEEIKEIVEGELQA